MKHKLSCSIAMTTFNGSNYILDQLESIVHQTRTPEEIVIVDDCSKDNTFELVKSFANSHKDIRFILKKNEKNIGFNGNFMQAVEHSNSDVIFFSDQDDVWQENKIECMMELLEENDCIKALKCSKIDFNSNENLSNIRSNMKSLKDVEAKRVSLVSVLKLFNCPGLTLAIRRASYLKIKDYVVANGNGYDVIAGLYFSAHDSLYSIDYPFVYHRIHSTNTTGKPQKRTKEFALKSLNRKVQWLKSSIELCEGDCKNKYFRLIKKTYNYYSKILECYYNNKKIKLLLNCLLPNKNVRYIYALSNAYFLLFR